MSATRARSRGIAFIDYIALGEGAQARVLPPALAVVGEREAGNPRVKELTPRAACHHDLRDAIERINPVIRGWGNYFGAYSQPSHDGRRLDLPMPQGNARELFCTPGDLLSLFGLVEMREGLAYAQTGLFEEAMARVYASGRDLPNLGVSYLGEASTEPAYLVLAAGQPVNVRPVAQNSGGVLYAVDQKWNPDTVVLKPGGVYGDECVIAGRLSTISTTSASQKLFALFSKAIRQIFSRHGSYWLGPEAHELWKKGVRLTIGAKVSSRFDLRGD